MGGYLEIRTTLVMNRMSTTQVRLVPEYVYVVKISANEMRELGQSVNYVYSDVVICTSFNARGDVCRCVSTDMRKQHVAQGNLINTETIAPTSPNHCF